MSESMFMTLNWVDYFILAILAMSTVMSFVRGFTKEAISLTTWIIAVLIGLKFSPMLSDVLKDIITTPSARRIVSFVVLFVLVLMIGGLINFLVSQMMTKTGLSGINRFIGSAFGFARGVLLVGVLVLLARHTALPDDPWWQESQLLPKFEPVADTIARFLPEKVHKISQLIIQ